MKKVIKLTESQLYEIVAKSVNEQLGSATQREIERRAKFQGKSPLKPAAPTEPIVKVPSGNAGPQPMPGTKPTTMPTKPAPKNPAPITTMDKKNIITFDPRNIEGIQRALGKNPTGIYDADTKTAVGAFQKANGINPSGYVNKATATKLRGNNSELAIRTMFAPNPNDSTAPTTSPRSTEVSTPDNEILHEPQAMSAKQPGAINSPAPKPTLSPAQPNRRPTPAPNVDFGTNPEDEIRRREGLDESIKRVLREYKSSK